MRVLLVDPSQELPAGTDNLLARNDWIVDRVPDLSSAKTRVTNDQVDAVVLRRTEEKSADVDGFFRSVESRHIAAVLVGSEDGLRSRARTRIDLAPPDISKEELSWRLDTLMRFQVQVRAMERELAHMQKLGQRLKNHFRELDDEMRLASRLQRDFLPRNVKSIGPLKFGMLYRPASWVSGDIFDIQQLDDRHVSFYIADAVGHGVSAGLLTMFIKRSIVSHRNVDGIPEISDPADVLRRLNDSLAQYTLPNCQFVTGVYCVINIETLQMKYVRGGHPHPIHIQADGRTTELDAVGGLMGIFAGMECETRHVNLHHGDKVILYTDGVEAALEPGSGGGTNEKPDFLSIFQPLADQPVEDLVASMDRDLNNLDGSLTPADDITVLAMEIVKP